MSANTFDVPLHISISVGDLPPAATSANAEVTLATASEGSGLERFEVDRDYSNREGYDPDFLGVAVPLPVLTEEQRRNAAKNTKATSDEDNTLLPYHHFSIVMNRRRQLAYYTAVNIDGTQSRRPPRTNRWCFDPRIAESEQIGGELYSRNALDQGHLVRRLDPAWGSASEALKANNDTFHYTNCSPQHADFNQNDETWQGIENFLLDHATNEKRKLVIFTGPVMTEDDPLYRGVRLPLAFWKIAVQVDSSGARTVSAYLLDQTDLVQGMEGLERFEPKTYQVTVDEIMARTGLDFSSLTGDQVDLAAEPEGLERADEYIRKPLARVSQISLGRRHQP